MPCCLFYCHLASQLDPKHFKHVFAFWFSNTTPPHTARRRSRFAYKLGRYVIVDVGGNRVTFRALNIRIKIIKKKLLAL